MKKMLSFVLALTLCMACAAASAAGFSGLSVGGFCGLSAGGGAEALPDPAKVTDSYGTLMQADYAFSSDYLCDAYIYERPRTISIFTDEYFSLCRKAGYTVTETTVDGVNAYSIQADDAHYALLVTNFDGQMLLLVQKGMDFSPMARTNYATIVYDHRDYEMELWYTNSYSGDWELTFKTERAPFSHLTIYIPPYARTGDVFYTDHKGQADGFSLMRDSNDFLVYDGGVSDRIFDPGEYAQMTLTKVEATDDSVLVEGVIEGNFYGGPVIEDFIFSGRIAL